MYKWYVNCCSSSVCASTDEVRNETQYDVIGSQVVQQMLHNQVMCSRYFRWFVQPAVALVQRRPQSKMKWVYNALVYLIFVAGLIAGQIHNRFTPPQ